jgi:hypothetical protein
MPFSSYDAVLNYSFNSGSNGLRQAGALVVGLENYSGLENNDTHLRGANACRCFHSPSGFPGPRPELLPAAGHYYHYQNSNLKPRHMN